MVDWGIAKRIATGVAGDPGVPALPADLAELCVDAERRVVAYTRMQPASPLPAPAAVGRPGWLEANLAGMRGVVDPLAERIGGGKGPLREPMKVVGGLLLAAEVGGLVGLLAQRVLGQYEMPPLDPDAPARLLFVAPNLLEAAERLDADQGDLLHWVALHEVTHAVQFSAVGWLRGHVASLLRELLGAMEIRVDARALARVATMDELRAAIGRLRSEGLVAAVLGAERRALLDRIQATMSLVEGHAEHVMDAAGADVVPNLADLRRALDRRRRDRPPLMRLLERLIGMEMKLRQYESGKRFCDAVVDEGGVELLNRAWEGPEALPTWEELQRPERWSSRIVA